MKHFRFTKLNATGFAHHLMIAFLVVAGVAGFGAYRILTSEAASATTVSISTAEGCALAGRVYSQGKCSTTCSKVNGKAVAFVKGKPAANAKPTTNAPVLGYCKGSINTNGITQADCVSKHHRKYVTSLGCARVAAQKNIKNAKQCVGGEYIYYVATKNIDYCSKTPPKAAPPTSASGRDTTRPVYVVDTEKMKTVNPQMIVSGQWTSVDPRTGFSLQNQSRVWNVSRRIANEYWQLTKYPENSRTTTVGTCKFTGKTSVIVKQLKACVDKQTNGAMYGIAKWRDENPANNGFTTGKVALSNGLFSKMYTLKPSNQAGNADKLFAKGIYCQTKKNTPSEKYQFCEFMASIGYNPNYFKSATEQAQWVSRNKIVVTPTQYEENDGTKKSAQVVISMRDDMYGANPHNGLAGSSFKYSDGTSPGYTGPITKEMKAKGKSPFSSSTGRLN